MKRVLIDLSNNRICDIVAIGAEFPVHPSLQWVDAPADVSHETHMLSGGVVTIKPAKPLAQLRTEKLASLEASRKQAIDNLPPVTVAGKLYPATPDFVRELSSIARRLAAGKPTPATLRDVDGASAPLNAVIIGQIDDAIAAAVQSVRDRYWTKFDAVNAPDATAASIAAVVW